MAVIKTRTFLKNFFSLGVVQVINSLLQLIVIPFVISRIGIAQFGVVAVAQVVVNYMATLTDYHYNQAGTKSVSLNMSDTNFLSVLFSKAYTVKAILVIISFAILFLLYIIFPFIKENTSLYLLAFIYVIGYALQPVWFLQGVEKMQWIAAASLTARIIFVGLILLFMKNPKDSWQYLFFLGAGLVIIGVTNIFFVSKRFELRWQMPAVNEIKEEIKTGWQITVSNISMNIMQYGNLFILRVFATDIIAGYFSVAERVFFTMKYALSIFSQSIFPGLCRAAAHSKSMLAAFLRKFFLPFFLLIVFGSTLIYVLAPQILGFFIKEVESDTIFILRILCLILPVISLNLPAALTLLAFDRTKTYTAVFTVALIINIGANILLAFYLKERGTLMAVFITEMFITAALWLSVRKIMVDKR